MRCLYLLTLVLGINMVKGQQKSGYLLQAEGLIATNIPQAIEAAKKAYRQSVQKMDNYNGCLSGIFLGNAYRKLDTYSFAIYYDSLAILQAKQRQSDTLLQQKAANSYARNFVETLQLDKAEKALKNEADLFTN